MSANWLNLLKAGESCATGARYWIAKIQIKVTMSLLMICLLVLGGRLLFIQGIDAEDQAQQAMDRRTRPVTLAPERGSILDGTAISLQSVSATTWLLISAWSRTPESGTRGIWLC